VVKAGFWKAALWMCQIDDGDIFWNVQPASRKARIAPMAEISLKEKGGEGCARGQQHLGGHVSE